jgi:dipeptidyl aminopeptidase/acylaminoacyl peptidase
MQRTFSTRLALTALVLVGSTLTAQGNPPTPPTGRQGGQGQGRQGGTPVVMDSARARALYVSNRPEDHPRANYDNAITSRKRTDSIYAARSRGVMDFRIVSYKSRPDGLEIPAYLFQPLQKRGARGHAAMVWIHGGVHSNFSEVMFPFVREAVQKGYVIIAPNYRGSTGFGEAFHNAIDYGGLEVDDVLSSVDFLKTLPHVDQDRLGAMGWSHGGFITTHLLVRDDNPFKAGAAIVPVTNLFVRLARSGPGYQRSFSTQKGIQGMPHEKMDEYIRRSPVFHLDKLKVPILVHVATNDRDVYYIEDMQMVHHLRSLKPDLAETKIYQDPAPWGGSVGHAFSRRVDPVTLERDDSREQIDSWERTWTFFRWNLRPDEDRSKPAPPIRTGPGAAGVPPI